MNIKTNNQRTEALLKKQIYDLSSRSEKTAWERKYKNLQKLLEQLQPFEDKIIELRIQKMEIFDKMQEIRNTMVQECIHPTDMLVVNDGVAECKFCNTKIKLVTADE